MRESKFKNISALVLALGILMAGVAQSATVVNSPKGGVPFPTKETPKPRELGDLR